VPDTWLARGGFFHSDSMVVYERFTRKGNDMLYEVTVEDPEVLLQPWKQNPMLMSLAEGGGDATGFGNPTLIGSERGFCEAYETEDVVEQIRH
jgi:hypothetical protein